MYTDYLREKKTPPRAVTDPLISMFYCLIENIVTSFNFSVDIDDAKQDSMVLVLRILNNFKASNGTAFNYFTTVIVNNLKLIYSKDKTYKLKLEEYLNTIDPIQE